METALMLRTFGGLLAVLALLAGALWIVKRYDIRLPGRVGGGRRGRLAVVERLTLDAKRSLVLIRRDGAEHLLLLAPEGPMQVEGVTEEAPFALELSRCREEAPLRLPPGWSRRFRPGEGGATA